VTYTQEFKSKIIEEVKEVNAISPVARKHSISASTIHGWVRGSIERVTYKKEINNKTLKCEVKNLKGKLADAELELMILKDLLKKATILKRQDHSG
jgi:transposase-like protein